MRGMSDQSRKPGINWWRVVALVIGFFAVVTWFSLLDFGRHHKPK
jgi:hypothetical protein